MAGVLTHFHVPVHQSKKIKVVDMSSMFVELRNEQVWIMCINTTETYLIRCSFVYEIGTLSLIPIYGFPRK